MGFNPFFLSFEGDTQTLGVPSKYRFIVRTLLSTRQVYHSSFARCDQLVLEYHKKWLEKGGLVGAFRLA